MEKQSLNQTKSNSLTRKNAKEETPMMSKAPTTKTTTTKYGQRIIANGVTVSNNTYETGLNNNDIIIGKPGSGKTGGYISYNLASPYGSYVVSDTKGLLFKRFGKYLTKLGYNVKVLDFVRPERSCAYNPLQYIRRNRDGSVREQDIKKIASIIMPTLDAKDPFWEKAATRYICMVMGYVLETKRPEQANMVEVIRSHHRFATEEGEMELKCYAKMHPESFAARKYNEIKGTANAEKTWACILEFANEALDPFGYNDFNPIFGKPDDVDIASVGKEKTVIFLNCSDNDPAFHVFSNIFNTQALQVLIEQADDSENGKLDVPVRIIFDDFAAGPKVEELDNMMSIIRSREISVSLIIQSMTQLKTKYEENVCNTIISNCDHLMYLSGNDMATAEYLSKHMNVPAKKILDLPADKTILITAGEEPVIKDKLKPYSLELMTQIDSVLEEQPGKQTIKS